MRVPFCEPKHKYGRFGRTEVTTRNWIPTSEDQETETKELRVEGR